MQISHAHFRLLFYVMLAACSNAGSREFSNILRVGAFDQGSNRYKDVPADDDDAPADEPAQVSGAFLSMAFMEGEDQTLAKIDSAPEEDVEIAVCLRDKRSLACIDDRNLKIRFEILTTDYERLAVEQALAPETSDFRFVLTIPVQHLAGTIFAFISDESAQKHAIRARSLASINEFGASNGRKPPGIDKSTNSQDWFDAKREIEALDTAQTNTGKIRSTNGQIPAAIPQNWFWTSTLGVIENFFGNSYAQPVTNFTIEPIVACACGGKLQFASWQSKKLSKELAAIPYSANAVAYHSYGGSGGDGGGGESGGDGSSSSSDSGLSMPTATTNNNYPQKNRKKRPSSATDTETSQSTSTALEEPNKLETAHEKNTKTEDLAE